MGTWCSRSSSVSVNNEGNNITYTDNELDLLEQLNIDQDESGLIGRLLGCAYGQALGDAYGLSTEFENRKTVAHLYPDGSSLIPFPTSIKTSHSCRWKSGDWTDDTDQWILILETLIESNDNEKVFARKLKTWIESGFPKLGDFAGLGQGANVRKVVYSKNFLKDPLSASRLVWEESHRRAAPNGAVMRCSASAFVYYNNIDKMKSTTISLCKTTHFDPRCIASCLAVCLATTYLINKKISNEEIESLIQRVQNETIDILGHDFTDEDRQSFLWHTDKSRTLEDLNLDEPNKIGYTYKCLASGFYGLRSTRSFQETLNDLIRYGGDADTNGAVCGTMYGARHGYQALPYKWLKAMPYKKWLDQKILNALEKMGLSKSNRL